MKISIFILLIGIFSISCGSDAPEMTEKGKIQATVEAKFEEDSVATAVARSYNQALTATAVADIPVLTATPIKNALESTPPPSPSSKTLKEEIALAVEATVTALGTPQTKSSAIPENRPAPTTIPIPRNQYIQATVTRVIDGDTVEIQLSDGSTDTLRMLGVDTPEISGSNKPREYGDITDLNCLDKWGDISTEYTKQTLADKQIQVIFDETSPRRGYYDRLLGYVELEGIDFTKSLIEKGYARVYSEGEGVRLESYSVLQDLVSADKIGLWGCLPEQIIGSHPEGASAICRDGTYSYSKSRRGTCSWHGGVSQWID